MLVNLFPIKTKSPTAVANGSPVRGVFPLTVNFSSAGSVDSDGTIASYDWNFGDGTTSTLQSPVHVYAAAGTYTVTLVVTDDIGLYASVSHSVTVANSGKVPARQEDVWHSVVAQRRDGRLLGGDIGVVAPIDEPLHRRIKKAADRRCPSR